jgi:hypothetical protein
MFETKKELAELQVLLDSSFAKSGNIRYSGFNDNNRYSARQLAGAIFARLDGLSRRTLTLEPAAARKSFPHARVILRIFRPD